MPRTTKSQTASTTKKTTTRRKTAATKPTQSQTSSRPSTEKTSTTSKSVSNVKSNDELILAQIKAEKEVKDRHEELIRCVIIAGLMATGTAPRVEDLLHQSKLIINHIKEDMKT